MILRKKSTRNRRVWQEGYLLEVKTPFNRRFSRQAQWVAQAMPYLGVAVVVGLVAWGGWLFINKKFFKENPNFKLHFVEATTDGVIPANELVRWTGAQQGQSLMATDVSRIKAQLERVPMVREAHVSKAFPDRLVVRVSERAAVAKVSPQGSSGLFFVGNDCVAFTAIKGGDGRVIVPAGTQKAPEITGIKASQIAPGQKVQSEGLMHAVELIQHAEKLGLAALVSLRRVDVSQSGVLKVIIGDRGGVAYLEPQNLDAQLRRLYVIVSHAKNERREVRTADMRPARNVAVTYF